MQPPVFYLIDMQTYLHLTRVALFFNGITTVGAGGYDLAADVFCGVKVGSEKEREAWRLDPPVGDRYCFLSLEDGATAAVAMEGGGGYSAYTRRYYPGSRDDHGGDDVTDNTKRCIGARRRECSFERRLFFGAWKVQRWGHPPTNPHFPVAPGVILDPP